MFAPGDAEPVIVRLPTSDVTINFPPGSSLRFFSIRVSASAGTTARIATAAGASRRTNVSFMEGLLGTENEEAGGWVSGNLGRGDLQRSDDEADRDEILVPFGIEKAAADGGRLIRRVDVHDEEVSPEGLSRNSGLDTLHDVSGLDSLERLRKDDREPGEADVAEAGLDVFPMGRRETEPNDGLGIGWKRVTALDAPVRIARRRSRLGHDHPQESAVPRRTARDNMGSRGRWGQALPDSLKRRPEPGR